MAEPMSLSAYARRRDVSVEAVSKAVKSGRLHGSIVMVDGRPKIGDAALADVEWQANTRPRIDQPPPQKSAPAKKPTSTRASTEDDGEPAGDGELPEGVPRYDVSRAIREHHEARRSGALADVAEIERDQVAEKVVPVDEVRAFITEKFTLVKTRLLGVPSRVAQRLPELAKEVEPVVDALIREVLVELADDGADAKADAA